MDPLLVTALLIVGLGTFLGYILRYSRILLTMEKESRMDALAGRLKALFGIGIAQQKMFMKKHELRAGIMHAFIFWGFMVLSIRTVTLFGVGFSESFHLPFLGPDSIVGYIYLAMKDVFEGIVAVMILYAMFRRGVTKPARLTLNGEAWFVLATILTLMLTDLFYDAARFKLILDAGNTYGLHIFNNPTYGLENSWTPVATFISWFLGNAEIPNLLIMYFSFWIHLFAILMFLCFLPNGKHFHVITALPNVFLKSIKYRHSPIKALDCEDEEAWEKESLGVKYVDQLTWKQGLDLYSCTECGRCYDVCPTHTTGKPLSLKGMNIDLKKHLLKSKDQLYKKSALEKQISKTTNEEKKGELEGQLEELLENRVELVGDVISEDTLWACTTCGACEEVCPVAIEHVPRIIGMRQAQTLMEEAQPSELNSTFKGTEKNANPWGIGYDKRADWAKGLEVSTMAEKSDVEYLFWVGCAGSFEDKAQKISRATAQLLKKAGVTFSILGTEEKCTGDSARRAGNEALFQSMAQDNIEKLNSYNIKKIVTGCPHCLNTLGNEYPEFGGNYEVIHHSELISDLVSEGKLKPQKKLEGSFTYHDPCYLGRYNKVYEKPRKALNSILNEGITEMPRSGRQSYCCGAGGARMWMEEDIGTRINENRVDEAAETGAKTVATGCPFCHTMVDDGIKSTDRGEKMQARDIAELVLEAVE